MVTAAIAPVSSLTQVLLLCIVTERSWYVQRPAYVSHDTLCYGHFMYSESHVQ